MLITPVGSAALDTVINQSLNPTSPSLCPCESSACSAGQGGLAETRDIPTPQSLEAPQWPQIHTARYTQPASKPRALRERGRCSWQCWFILGEVGRFSPWSQRHTVPWMMHSNGIAAIRANSFLDVRKELWNSVSKIREKFLRQPESFGERVTNDCPSCDQNKQWHYKSQDRCAVCPYLTSLKSEKYKKLRN